MAAPCECAFVFVVTADGAKWDLRIEKQVPLKWRWEDPPERLDYFVRPTVDRNQEFVDILRIVVRALFLSVAVVRLHSREDTVSLVDQSNEFFIGCCSVDPETHHLHRGLWRRTTVY